MGFCFLSCYSCGAGGDSEATYGACCDVSSGARGGGTVLRAQRHAEPLPLAPGEDAGGRWTAGVRGPHAAAAEAYASAPLPLPRPPFASPNSQRQHGRHTRGAGLFGEKRALHPSLICC